MPGGPALIGSWESTVVTRALSSNGRKSHWNASAEDCHNPIYVLALAAMWIDYGEAIIIPYSLTLLYTGPVQGLSAYELILMITF